MPIVRTQSPQTIARKTPTAARQAAQPAPPSARSAPLGWRAKPRVGGPPWVAAAAAAALPQSTRRAAAIRDLVGAIQSGTVPRPQIEAELRRLPVVSPSEQQKLNSPPGRVVRSNFEAAYQALSNAGAANARMPAEKTGYRPTVAEHLLLTKWDNAMLLGDGNGAKNAAAMLRRTAPLSPHNASMTETMRTEGIG